MLAGCRLPAPGEKVSNVAVILLALITLLLVGELFFSAAKMLSFQDFNHNS